MLSQTAKHLRRAEEAVDMIAAAAASESLGSLMMRHGMTPSERARHTCTGSGARRRGGRG
jgi:hypothetical protein